MVEHAAHNRLVVGSNPAGGIFNKNIKPRFLLIRQIKSGFFVSNDDKKNKKNAQNKNIMDTIRTQLLKSRSKLST
jgi:hypothetical protein